MIAGIANAAENVILPFYIFGFFSIIDNFTLYIWHINKAFDHCLILFDIERLDIFRRFYEHIGLVVRHLSNIILFRSENDNYIYHNILPCTENNFCCNRISGGIMLEITEQNFEKEVLKHKGIVIVYHSSSWCVPCKRASPAYESLSKELKKIKFTKVDVEQHPQLASSLGVMSIPTFIVFKHGKEINRLSGFESKEDLKERMEKMI